MASLQTEGSEYKQQQTGNSVFHRFLLDK